MPRRFIATYLATLEIRVTLDVEDSDEVDAEELAADQSWPRGEDWLNTLHGDSGDGWSLTGNVSLDGVGANTIVEVKSEDSI